jgi:hypothetical protein
MADIRISALPLEPAPSGADYVPIDLASTRRTTVTLLTEAGRPAATQAEAEAGVQATHAMTPLLTKQAITFQGAASFVPQSRILTAGSGLTGGGNLSADRSFAVDFASVQAFSTKLTNFDGTSNTAGALVFAAGVNTWTVLPIGTNNQVLQIIGGNPSWQNVPGTGDVVGPASAINNSIVTFNTATGKLIGSGNPVMSDLLSAERGPISTISNNSGDPTNDIDFSAGSAFSSDAAHWPMVGAALTKQLDASWAVGNNAGGRMSAAAIANGTYHCFQIRRPDTGVVDYGFDVSATAPTLPANYTQYRRIGSILREAGTIIPFFQTGNIFNRVNQAIDRNNTAAVASALLTLSIPSGIVCYPILRLSYSIGVSINVSVNIGSAVMGTANLAVLNLITGAGDTTDSGVYLVPTIFASNTSSQVYFSQTNTTGTPTTAALVTHGWVDTFL